MNRIVWSLSALVLAGCSGISVRQDYQQGTDFSRFKTYAWKQDSSEDESNPLLADRIRSAVDDVLAAKGMRKVKASEADLLVSERVTVEEKLRVNDPYFAYKRYQVYKEGTLLIDFYDPVAKWAVWRGIGETRLKELESPKDREARVREVVGAILAQYPPS